MTRAALLLALCSCNPAVGITIYDGTGADTDALDIVSQWVDVYPSDDGPLHLFVVRDRLSAETELKHGCTRFGWTISSPQAMAHEMGHMLGLQHQDADGFVMSGESTVHNTETTDKERRRVQRAARFLETCR